MIYGPHSWSLWLSYQIAYRARSADALEWFQAEFSARLPAEHTARYAGRFDARREILPIVHSATANPSQGDAGSRRGS